MSFSAGTYSRLYSWVVDRLAGTLITDTRFDAEMDGFADGLTLCVLKDGSQTITANLPLNDKKITGLGAATADADAMNRTTSDGRYPRLVGGTSLSVVTAVSASTVDLSLGRYFTKTAVGALTWVFSGPVATGYLDGFTLALTNGGLGTQTWPSSVKWPGGVAPTFTTSGVDVLVFITADGGTTWRGSMAMRNSS